MNFVLVDYTEPEKSNKHKKNERTILEYPPSIYLLKSTEEFYEELGVVKNSPERVSSVTKKKQKINLPIIMTALVVTIRKVLIWVCSWISYFVRSLCKSIAGDTSFVGKIIYITFVITVACLSYIYVRDIYNNELYLEDYGNELVVKDEVVYELGDLVILDPRVFLESGFGGQLRLTTALIDHPDYEYNPATKEIKTRGLDFLGVGSYEIKLEYRDYAKTCRLIVNDTTPPDVTNVPLYQERYIKVLQYSKTLNIEDTIKQTVEDNSIYTRFGRNTKKLVVSVDDSGVDYNKVGMYIAWVTVTDQYGNMARPFDINVEVIENDIRVNAKEDEDEASEKKESKDTENNNDLTDTEENVSD